LTLAVWRIADTESVLENRPADAIDARVLEQIYARETPLGSPV
jgi:hypothetical protein